MDQLELTPDALNPGEVITPVQEPEEQAIKCHSCSDPIKEDQEHEHDGDKYCEECFWDKFRDCDCCGLTHDRDELRYSEQHEQDVCERCVYRYYTYFNSDLVRDDWYSENVVGCGHRHCSAEELRDELDDISYCDATDDYRCSSHWESSDECDDDECGEISSYGHTSGLPFFGTPADRIFFGAELEVEVEGFRDPAAALAKDYLGRDFIETKHDGSLSNGFEIVTAPADLASHRARWAKFFDNIESFKPHKMRSWNTKTCGMHVHVSRRPLTQLQIGKIVEFIHNPANYSLVRKIAGRHSDNYGGYNTEKKIKDVKCSGDRYTAINLTNRATIEFRLFKGTLLKAGFFRNLEFVHALVNYTKPAARSIPESVNGQLFCKWLLTPGVKENYPNLISFLADRNFLTLPAKKARPELNTLNTTEVCA